jgi:hypothetical protein
LQGRSKEIERTLRRSIVVYEKHLKMVINDKALEDAIKIHYAQRVSSLGYHYLKEGKMSEARQMFSRSLSIVFNRKVYIMKLLTYLPFKVLHLSNKLAKSVVKTPEIVKSKEDLERLVTLNENG